MRLQWGSGLDGLFDAHAAVLIQFPKVRHHPLSRTAGRAIRLHQRPIGVSLPVLRSVAAPHVHGAHPTDLFPACNRVGLHYTPLLPPLRTTSHDVASKTKALPLTIFEKKRIKVVKFFSASAHAAEVGLAAIESVRQPRQKTTDKVFPCEGTEGRYDTRSWFVPCLAEAEITGYVWHSNQHTFCSWLAMAGATIKEIQELAGHKTITMYSRYAHLSPDHELSEIDRIASTATETATRTAIRPQAGTATRKGTAIENPNSHQNDHREKAATRRKRS